MIARPMTVLISQDKPTVSKYPEPPLPAEERKAQETLDSTVTNAWLLQAVTSLLGLSTTFLCRAHPPSHSYCSSQKGCYSFIDLCFLNYKCISILLQVIFKHHSDWSFPCSKTSSISWPQNYYYLFQRKLTAFDVYEG